MCNEIERIQRNARLEEAIERMNKSIANLHERKPGLLDDVDITEDLFQWEIDNCVKYECFRAAAYLKKIKVKKYS